MSDYYILAFENTRDAISGMEYAKQRICYAVMPIPSEISSGCGLAIRFPHDSEENILIFCRDIPLSCTLYRMKKEKINGVRPVTKLFQKEA